MLKIYHEDPVIIDRHIGHLEQREATHHFCKTGTAPHGTLLASYGLHPDVVVPPDVYVRVDVPRARHPVYKFRPREAYPDYRWPFMGACCRSEDAGRSWSKPVLGTSCNAAAAVGARTVCLNGEPAYLFAVEPGLAVTSMGESDDDGRTWRDRPDVYFHYPPDLGLCVEDSCVAGARVIGNFDNRASFKRLSDGSLVTFVMVSVDRSRPGDPWSRWLIPLMFRSTDGGYNFQFVSLPAGMPPLKQTEATRGVRALVEPGLAELPNGELLAVFRTGYHQPDRVMLQARSSDGGVSWSELIACPGVPRYYPVRRLQPIVNEGKTHMNNAGVSPWLAALPSGVVAMVYGRPGLHITFSEDGTGSEWRDRIPIVPEPSLFGVNCDSSAMAGVEAVGENELVVVYDIHNYKPPDGGPVGNTVFSLRMTVEKA